MTAFRLRHVIGCALAPPRPAPYGLVPRTYEQVQRGLSRLDEATRDALINEAERGPDFIAPYVQAVADAGQQAGTERQRNRRLELEDVYSGICYLHAEKRLHSLDGHRLGELLDQHKFDEAAQYVALGIQPRRLAWPHLLLRNQVRAAKLPPGNRREQLVQTIEDAIARKDRRAATVALAYLTNYAAPRPDLHIDWGELFERLEGLRVPGCLQAQRLVTTTLPGLADLKARTFLEIAPNAQALALGLQVYRQPDDDNPNFYLDKNKPAILIARDGVHLGTDNAPRGFLSKDGREVIIPARIYVRVVAVDEDDQPIRELDPHETPFGPVALQSDPVGIAHRFPVEIELGGQTRRLMDGRYQPDVEHRREGPLLHVSAGGQTVSINTETGRRV